MMRVVRKIRDKNLGTNCDIKIDHTKLYEIKLVWSIFKHRDQLRSSFIKKGSVQFIKKGVDKGLNPWPHSTTKGGMLQPIGGWTQDTKQNEQYEKHSTYTIRKMKLNVTKNQLTSSFRLKKNSLILERNTSKKKKAFFFHLKHSNKVPIKTWKESLRLIKL